jgi:Ni/Fe-hydrogenase subunit HybB-like protein
VWFIALGLLLPTMHQSSLGGVLLLAGQRLHALWNTPLLPLLFLLSCLSMGYAAVILESTMASAVFKRPFESSILAGVGGIVIWVQLGFVALRLGDILLRGHLSTLFAFDLRSTLVLIEFALLLAPVVLLRSAAARQDKAVLFRGALLLAAGGAMYRIDSYLVAFQPGAQWSYFPSLGEMVSSLGLIAIETLAYIVIVKQFPILSGAPSARRQEVAV